MKLGKDGREHAVNMKRSITLIDGTITTMAEIDALISKNAGDNGAYAVKFATDAFFAGDTEKLTQLVDALKS